MKEFDRMHQFTGEEFSLVAKHGATGARVSDRERSSSARAGRPQPRTLSWLVILAVCTTVLPCLGETGIPQNEQFIPRTWQVRDGLMQPAVQALAQTPDGYLWIGTTNGLVRFDGSRFVTFNHLTSGVFGDDSVWSLAVDSSGTLWIGTEGGGLISLRDQRFKAYGTNQGLENRFVRAIYPGPNNLLWVGTDDGVYTARDTGGELSLFNRVDGTIGIPKMNVYTIHADEQGRICVGGSGLLIVDPAGGLRSFHARSGGDDGMVGAVVPNRSGGLWVGTQAALRFFPRSQLISAGDFDPFDSRHRVTTLRLSKGQKEFSTRRIHISVITEAHDGTIWIGTWGNGLFHIANSETSWFNAPEFIPDGHISSIFEDADKNLWIGTPGGLTLLRRSGIALIEERSETPVAISAVTLTSHGLILSSTVEGKLLQGQANTLVPAEIPGLPKNVIVRSTFEDRNGTLWIGTAGQGVFSVSSGQATHFDGPDFVRAFAEAPDGHTLWIGTDGGLWCGSVNGFRPYASNRKSSVRALVFDHQGILWAGSDNGLERIREGQIDDLPGLNPLNSVKIWSLLVDRIGDVWIGTHGSGLYLWQKDKLTHYTSVAGYPSESFYSLLEDATGRVWSSGPEGIWSIDREDLIRASETGQFGRSLRFYGEPSSELNSGMSGGVQQAAVVTASNVLLFAARRGLISVQTANVPKVKPFHLSIEQILEDGRVVAQGSPIDIGADVGQTEIDYAAIRLSLAERTRFRYRLEGLDDHWNDAGTSRAAFYTHVPPGSYRFHVEALDPGASDPIADAVLPITFLPHFYQMAWFYVLVAFAVLALIALLFLLHRRRLHLRFAAVLAERNRLAREMHDTLIQGCIGVSTLLEAAFNMEETHTEKSRMLLARASAQNKQSIDEARQAVWNLRHADAEKTIPLALLLNAVINDAGEGTTANIHLCLDERLPSVCPEQGESISLVVREAMLNAARHADPNNITIRAESRRKTIYVEIADDGSGFSEASAGPLHYGITGMRERVAELGGKMQIQTSKSAGTTISIQMPLVRANRVVGRNRE